MTRPQFDVLLIDFFGTIAAGDRPKVEDVCRRVVRDHELSISAVEFSEKWGRQFFAVSDESNAEHFKTLYECECLSLRRTLREFDVECDAVQYVDELKRYWRNPPLHADARQALSNVPVRTCLVSNADEDDVLAAISAQDLTFDGVVTSERARAYKPHKIIFEQALDMMQVQADRCVHVGDSLHSDVFGAQQLGIAAAWLERDGRISDIGSCKPDYTLKSLSELVRFFG